MTTMGKAMRFPRGRNAYATLPRTGPFTEPQPGTRISAGATTRPRLARAPLLLLLLSLLAPPALAQPKIDPPDTYLEVTRRLEPWIAAELQQKGIPALSIALVDDQKIVWARGFGFADVAKQIPATANTVYRVGSVSKLFTDLAVMQLVEQGKLDLDKPVSDYVPEFAPKNPFKGPITLRQLMSHRSGLVREPPVGHYFDPAAPSLIEVVRSLATTTLVFEPGTRTKYSNAGITVVGAVVEKVAGEPFPAAIDHALLKPLGMAYSSFQPGPELQAQLAHGMMWTYDGQTMATPTFLLGTGPAGNLVSSVVDLGHFLSFLFAEGSAPTGRLIKAETLRAMIEPQLAKPGETPGFGLGFAISTLGKRATDRPRRRCLRLRNRGPGPSRRQAGRRRGRHRRLCQRIHPARRRDGPQVDARQGPAPARCRVVEADSPTQGGVCLQAAIRTESVLSSWLSAEARSI